MAFREVSMIEVKEVLRLWLAGVPKKQIAAQLGPDPKTVRRYVAAGESVGLCLGLSELSDEAVGKVLVALKQTRDREHGDAWCLCEEHKEFITKGIGNRVRLSKVRKLLLRQGVLVPYSTLHRFAVEELGFGRAAPTVPIADGEPGHELQVDTGWVVVLTDPVTQQRRKVRAWIFTPNVSRYRFVYPCLKETTRTAIEACEAAWAFYGGVFHVLIPDNTKAIVNKADSLDAKINLGFLEYAQARGFHIDPTRARHPKDKARVERSVRDTRDDCFGGENLATVEEARIHAERWYAEDYGRRPHSTTLRMPREHFDAEEKAHLLPAPTAPYDIPEWSEPKVARDHFAQVARGLYSLPTRLIGRRLRARADRNLVRFYDQGVLVKTHPRVPPGKKAIDRDDFPAEKTPYALRDVAFLHSQAREHGEAIGYYAEALLAGPLPWAKMRRVRALIGLADKYGDARVEKTCQAALAADMIDVRRLQRMLELAIKPPTSAAPLAKVIPIARYLRPAKQYALPFLEITKPEPDQGED